MRRRRRRDVMIARIIFAVICVAIIAVIASVIIVIASRNKKKDEVVDTETQVEQVTEIESEVEEIPTYIPNDTQIIEQESFVVTTDAVRLRKEPSTEATALLLLENGTKLKYISEDNGWTEVEMEDGTHGYVKSDYVEAVELETPEAEEPDQGEDTASSNSISSQDRSQYVIVIDAGHQAHGNADQEPEGPGATETKKKVSSGTKGSTTGVYEFELTLDIALQLQTELETRGYVVKMTRSTHDVDMSNKERAEFAASEGGSIFVRIHANGSDSSDTNGALALAPSKENKYVANLSEASAKLSKCILNAYCTSTGMANHGVKANDSMSGINWSTIPVTILEMGYMTNPDDDKNMQNDAYQSRMVQGIANGIDDYFFK